MISPFKPIVKGNTLVSIEAWAPGKWHFLSEVMTYAYTLDDYAIREQLFIGKWSLVNHYDRNFKTKSNHFSNNWKKVAIIFIRPLNHFVSNRSWVTVIILPLSFRQLSRNEMILDTLRFFSSRIIIVQSPTQGELKCDVDHHFCLTTMVTANI